MLLQAKRIVVEEHVGNGRAEERFALGHRTHRANQIRFRRILQEIAPDASVHRPHEVFLVGIHAEDENSGSLAPTSNLGRRFETVQSRHRDIHDHDVRAQLLRKPDRLRSVVRFTDDDNMPRPPRAPSGRPF